MDPRGKQGGQEQARAAGWALARVRRPTGTDKSEISVIYVVI